MQDRREGAGGGIQEAWIGGVSTRWIDELVQAMGFSGISCSSADEKAEARAETIGAP